jgi:hypothetical protein
LDAAVAALVAASVRSLSRNAAMDSFCCFQQLQSVRVQFQLSDHRGFFEVKQELPYVGEPVDDSAQWQLDAGSAVTLTLPGGKTQCFFVGRIYWCFDTGCSPLLLLSRVKDPSMYTFAMVVPGVRCPICGGRKRFYNHVTDRSGDLVQKYEDRLFRVRQFIPDRATDFPFPTPVLPPAEHTASSSSSSMPAGPTPSPQDPRAEPEQAPSPQDLEAAHLAVTSAASASEVFDALRDLRRIWRLDIREREKPA